MFWARSKLFLLPLENTMKKYPGMLISIYTETKKKKECLMCNLSHRSFCVLTVFKNVIVTQGLKKVLILMVLHS